MKKDVLDAVREYREWHRVLLAATAAVATAQEALFMAQREQTRCEDGFAQARAKANHVILAEGVEETQ